MSIIIKVPQIPTANTIKVERWHKKIGDFVARGEAIVDLKVIFTQKIDIAPIISPQAGIVERIFYAENQEAQPASLLLLLKESLPNIVWDEKEKLLLLETIRPEDITQAMNYQLREFMRTGEGQFGGYGSPLAVPQIHEQANYGSEKTPAERTYFKANSLLYESSQFTGDAKNPYVCSNPVDAAINPTPQMAPSLTPQARPGSAPTPTLKPGS